MRAATRFTSIIRAVAGSGSRGLTLAELARACELDKASTLRLARALAEEGWLKAGAHGRWDLGNEAWVVGHRAAPQMQTLLATATPRLARLCSQTQDTVYLAVASGLDVVFVARFDGDVPARASIETGSRHPWVLGCSGMAWLAALEAGESARALDKLASRMKALGIDRTAFARDLAQTKQQGFAFTTGSRLFGVPALGMAVRDLAGSPIACVTVSANADRFTPEHVAQTLPLLRRCVKNIERAAGASSKNPAFR